MSEVMTNNGSRTQANLGKAPWARVSQATDRGCGLDECSLWAQC